MSYRRVPKKQIATDYCVRVQSLVTVRNQLPAQRVENQNYLRSPVRFFLLPLGDSDGRKKSLFSSPNLRIFITSPSLLSSLVKNDYNETLRACGAREC